MRLLLQFANKLGRFARAVESNPDAAAVLRAFDLAQILDSGFVDSLTQQAANQPVAIRLIRLREDWRVLSKCAKPIETLTTPTVELGADEAELDINITDRDTLTLESLIAILSDLQSLYETGARITEKKEFEPLQVIKIDSGTNVSINLKGLGEPIKQIKNLILEMWAKYRHKRAKEIIDQNRVVASSIELIEVIETKRKNGFIADQEAKRLTRALVSKTLSLFENGALIAEIPERENIDNAKLLLEGFGPKRLPPPEPPSNASSTPDPRTPPSPRSIKSDTRGRRRKRGGD